MKKNLKKVVTLLVVGAMGVSLAACGSSSELNEADIEAEEEVVEGVAIEKEVEEEIVEEEAAAAEAEAEDAEGN